MANLLLHKERSLHSLAISEAPCGHCRHPCWHPCWHPCRHPCWHPCSAAGTAGTHAGTHADTEAPTVSSYMLHAKFVHHALAHMTFACCEFACCITNGEIADYAACCRFNVLSASDVVAGLCAVRVCVQGACIPLSSSHDQLLPARCAVWLL
jgi:hypothetical protein